jgi:23S rRNA pseudouridine1911/1915/1917 synthase
LTEETGRVLKIEAQQGSQGERLDVYLSRRLSGEFSRSRIQVLIDEDNILLNGERPKASARLRPGDVMQVTVPAPREWDVAPEDIPLEVVYEDDDILVINKPRGMVVHPAAGHWEGTLVNAVLSRCPGLRGIGGEVRPGIVHRLDKDTTGLLVVAKDEKALRDLQAQLKERKVKRQYVALLRGRLKDSAGTVNAPIGRHPVRRKKMAVVPSGRPAVTDYEVLARFGDEYTLVLARLRTGRTHQIRVHFAHLGHPVAGDPVYSRGEGELGLGGQALHAARLGLYKPSGGDYVEFTAPLPGDFRSALETLEKTYKEESPKWLR